MGYTLHEAVPGNKNRFTWRMILLYIVVANLPDVDFIPGLFVDSPNRFHHHYLSHSLAFAVFVGGLLAIYFSRRQGGRFVSHFLTFTGICFSHLVLDYFTADTSAPFGVPMFWPISSRYFYSSFSIFMSVHKSGTSSDFIQSLFVLHNLWVALWEMLIFVPIFTMIKLVQNRKRLLLKFAK